MYRRITSISKADRLWLFIFGVSVITAALQNYHLITGLSVRIAHLIWWRKAWRPIQCGGSAKL